ncbi:MAG: hypothetical protein KIG33_07215 [Oscillospiraceae bacterium]|nr:hypothetical protein [Oscillospiraceae bacterium]
MALIGIKCLVACPVKGYNDNGYPVYGDDFIIRTCLIDETKTDSDAECAEAMQKKSDDYIEKKGM